MPRIRKEWGEQDPSSVAGGPLGMAGPFAKIVSKGLMDLPGFSLPLTMRRAIRSIPRHLRALLKKGKPLQVADQPSFVGELFGETGSFREIKPPKPEWGPSYKQGGYQQIMVDPDLTAGAVRTEGGPFAVLRHELEHALRTGGRKQVPDIFLEEAAPLAREGGKGVVKKLREAGYAKFGQTAEELGALAAEESATRGLFPGSRAIGDFPGVPQELGEIYKNILRMENKQLRALHKAKGKLRRPR